jgi:hypothetical protein
MQELAIVRTLLSSEPELHRPPAEYSPPSHIADAGHKYYRNAYHPPRDFHEDTSWVYHHWEWTGNTRPDGQMFIYAGGRQVPIHRFIWQLTRGAVPADQYARPACGKMDCVSQHHLRLRSRRSRSRVLSDRDLSNIRHLFLMEDDPASARQLARIFKVSEQHIYRIVSAPSA